MLARFFIERPVLAWVRTMGCATSGVSSSCFFVSLGLGLFALVIVKLYLLDVWSLSRGFRITAFLALGGLLLLVSYLYSRFKPALERLWRPEAAEPETPPEDRSAGERSSI